MTIKERIIEQLDALDEVQLAAIEEQLRVLGLKEEFRVLDELAGPMSEEDKAAFEAMTHRRSLFGSRKLGVRPDDV